MIKCVCLVEETEDQILLVQVRHREKYYFPGGKIDEGEKLFKGKLKKNYNFIFLKKILHILEK